MIKTDTQQCLQNTLKNTEKGVKYARTMGEKLYEATQTPYQEFMIATLTCDKHPATIGRETVLSGIDNSVLHSAKISAQT